MNTLLIMVALVALGLLIYSFTAYPVRRGPRKRHVIDRGDLVALVPSNAKLEWCLDHNCRCLMEVE